MNSNMQNIRTLRHELEVLHGFLEQIPDTLKIETDIANIERSHAHIQNLFQTQILNQPDQELNIPYYVEINKQLRLFSADLNLIKTTQKPQTFTKRIKQAGDRLSLLLTYCDNLLAKN